MDEKCKTFAEELRLPELAIPDYEHLTVAAVSWHEHSPLVTAFTMGFLRSLFRAAKSAAIQTPDPSQLQYKSS